MQRRSSDAVMQRDRSQRLLDMYQGGVGQVASVCRPRSQAACVQVLQQGLQMILGGGHAAECGE